MNRSSTYPLALSGILILTLVAQSMLFAAHLHASVLDSIPPWVIAIIGAPVHLLGMLLLACVLLNYSRTTQMQIFVISSFVLGSGGFFLFQKGLVTEAVLLSGLAIGFLLSNWIPSSKDWLVETIQWTNLLIGIGLFWQPDFMLPAKEYFVFQGQMMRFSYGALLLASAAVGFALSPRPVLGNYRSNILAAPWVLWGIMFSVPFSPFNAIIPFSISAGLIFRNMIPWQKIILEQSAKIGRYFTGLIFGFMLVSLALAAWLIQSMGNAPMPPILREMTFASYAVMTLTAFIVIASVNFSINNVFNGPGVGKTELDEKLFQQKDQDYEKLLIKQLNLERRRIAQLNLFRQLNLELESVLDPPVSAQLTANAIINAISSTLACVFQYDPERNDLVAIATSGPQVTTVPPGYRQALTCGLVGRAARLRHSQLASNTRLDADYFKLENQDSLSEIAVPLLIKNKLRGVIVVDDALPNAFDESDIKMLETVAVQLVTSWERSEHDQRLTNLIGAGITLSTTLDVEGVIQEIAEIARQTLDARFVFVTLADKGGGYTRTAHVGYAPTLSSVLNSDPAGNSLIQTSLNSASAFRLRDVRKQFPSTPTGSKNLRSLLAIPIRLRESTIGVILAFGKRGSLSFSEGDESLASLLTMQAAAAIETTWLYQELRSTFTTTAQLYQLSTRVIQSEQLTDAAASIAETAYQVSKAHAAGIVLFTTGKEIEAKVQIDANGIHPGARHPMNLIKQAGETGQGIIVSGPKNLIRICLPLQTPRRQYGALWVEVPEEDWNKARYSDNLHTLANQAAIALERSILLVETRKQAEEIEDAYLELETTYDQTLAALSSALDARDRETEGHSLRVAHIAHGLAREFGLSAEQAKTLQRGAILHDIGKIGVSDGILLKPGPLDPQEWQMMRQHPDIGARIIEGIPFLQEALPVIRYHQERWDGSGYPIGLKGTDIPLIARIFAVVDTFDALTTHRPYRSPVSVKESMDYISSNSGILFDPAIVKVFGKMIDDGIVAGLV